ncbi:MAG TPA: methyltransferase domain-containing protein [Candidatus Dormibacteraeota bacterium]
MTTEGRFFWDAEGYDRSTARWSAQLARELVPWLGVRRDARWLDVGCGTGVVTDAIMDLAWPGAVTGIDPSEAYLEAARRKVPGARFEVGDATALPFPDASFDAVVCSLVIAFVADPATAVAQMARVTAPGGFVGLVAWDPAEYLWHDYWEAAQEAGAPGGGPEQITDLPGLVGGAGLRDAQTRRITITVTFDGFDDYWQTLLGRKGHVADHFASQPPATQAAIRESVRLRVERKPGAKVPVAATAWAAKARR